MAAAAYGGLAPLPFAFAQSQARSEGGGSGLMAEGRPSITAQGAAVLRAAHQLLDEPKILDDPLALSIIGKNSESLVRADPERYSRSRALRASVAVRSRYAEDQLEAAIARGVRQYVILGAGLDTFAYRNPHPQSRLRVFEVDHPATQFWKRERLREAEIAIPDSLRFAPIDFERQTLANGLADAGFDATKPAFFSMLGVAIYLTTSALMETLRFVASLPVGTEIVFSYSVPASLLTENQRLAREKSARAVLEIGEPWISFYEPSSLEADLQRLGFGTVVDFGPEETNEHYFKDRADGLRVSGGRLMRAGV